MTLVCWNKSADVHVEKSWPDSLTSESIFSNGSGGISALPVTSAPQFQQIYLAFQVFIAFVLESAFNRVAY